MVLVNSIMQSVYLCFDPGLQEVGGQRCHVGFLVLLCDGEASAARYKVHRDNLPRLIVEFLFVRVSPGRSRVAAPLV